MSLLGQPGNRAHRQTRSLFQQLSLPLDTPSGAPSDATSPLAASRAPVLGRGNSREPANQASGRSPSALSIASA
jgi:hypothetical protein